MTSPNVDARRTAHDPDIVTAGFIVLAALGTLVVLRVVFRHAPTV